MHGFGHIEIPTTNFKKAKKFFGTVFGWTFQDVPDMDYVLFRAGAKPNGGFYELKKMPKKGQVNVYIEVGDIAGKLKQIKKAKGKVLVKKTDMGAMGSWAQFATPDGCVLCLWQPAMKASKPKARALKPAKTMKPDHADEPAPHADLDEPVPSE
ncbi:MAG TPA: VOC family protein [Bacteroidota bacterium]|nr:VOC family protein [Bacteroidota bacterium]HTS00856.1 VOC family protein [Bacteroidota bacterium]